MIPHEDFLVVLNKYCALDVYGVFAVYNLGFSSKQFQSCNKYLINQTCSGPYWENIGPWSFLYVKTSGRYSPSTAPALG